MKYDVNDVALASLLLTLNIFYVKQRAGIKNVFVVILAVAKVTIVLAKVVVVLGGKEKFALAGHNLSLHDDIWVHIKKFTQFYEIIKSTLKTIYAIITLLQCWGQPSISLVSSSDPNIVLMLFSFGQPESTAKKSCAFKEQ